MTDFDFFLEHPERLPLYSQRIGRISHAQIVDIAIETPSRHRLYYREDGSARVRSTCLSLSMFRQLGLTDSELAQLYRRVLELIGGPKPHAKRRVTLYLDETILDHFRAESSKTGEGYQTLINDVLARHVAERAARP